MLLAGLFPRLACQRGPESGGHDVWNLCYSTNITKWPCYCISLYCYILFHIIYNQMCTLSLYMLVLWCHTIDWDIFLRYLCLSQIYYYYIKLQVVNYRPVSLTCITCKLFEHISKHVLDHLEQHTLLYSYLLRTLNIYLCLVLGIYLVEYTLNPNSIIWNLANALSKPVPITGVV